MFLCPWSVRVDGCEDYDDPARREHWILAVSGVTVRESLRGWKRLEPRSWELSSRLCQAAIGCEDAFSALSFRYSKEPK
jgi:hypothetical protein